MGNKRGWVSDMSKQKKSVTNPLLCVKSIITIVLCVAFSILCFVYPETYEETMKTVIVSVITFYFAHQIGKSSHEQIDDDERNDGNDKGN